MPTQTPPINKKALASERMRRNILQVTIEILGGEGYAALTANRLSQQAGISKGALYHHFANLDDVRHHALSYLLNTFVAVDEPNTFANFEDYLSSNGRQLFMRIKKQPLATKALYVFMFEAMVDGPLRQRIQQLMKQSLSEYTHAFEYFFPAMTTQQLSQSVLMLDAYFSGAIFHWFLLDDEVGCLFSWEMFSQLLINHLHAMSES